MTPGVPGHLPMLEAGQIFRVRLDEKKDGSWKADAMVELRPARLTQLAPPWGRPHSSAPRSGRRKEHYEYRIEEDRAGTRKPLAASVQVEVDASAMMGPTTVGEHPGTLSPRLLFTGEQQEFLAACADRRVVVDALTPLGPVQATRWETEVGEFDTTVERWTLGELDLLELSIRLAADSPLDPRDRLIAFSAAVAARGISPFDSPDTKTRRVLEHLARRTGG